jgi:hypothetical protein
MKSMRHLIREDLIQSKERKTYGKSAIWIPEGLYTEEGIIEILDAFRKRERALKESMKEVE